MSQPPTAEYSDGVSIQFHCVGAATATVLTVNRALMAGIAVHPTATLAVVIQPDTGGLFTALSCISTEHLANFLGQLQPRNVTVEGMPGEDVTALRLAFAITSGAMH